MWTIPVLLTKKDNIILCYRTLPKKKKCNCYKIVATIWLHCSALHVPSFMLHALSPHATPLSFSLMNEWWQAAKDVLVIVVPECVAVVTHMATSERLKFMASIQQPRQHKLRNFPNLSGGWFLFQMPKWYGASPAQATDFILWLTSSEASFVPFVDVAISWP